MKSRIFLAVITLSLIFSPYGVPVGRAMADQSVAEPAVQVVQTDISAERDIPVSEQVPDEISSVPGATQDWWTAAQEQIRQDMYAISSNAELDDIPPYSGKNHAHNFDLSFSSGGLHLTPVQAVPQIDAQSIERALTGEGAKQEQQWRWDLRVTGLGYQDDVQPVTGAVETVTRGNRIAYQRAGITEWYINDQQGLEQGFTIHQPPSSASVIKESGEKSLSLEMVLVTGLSPKLSDDGQTIDFAATGAGPVVTVLRYSKLRVTDAAGKELRAYLELDTQHSADKTNYVLRVVVDTAGATYPLTVDPLITTPEWTALGENGGDRFGYSVGTAGDVNGDGYDDVVIGATFCLHTMCSDGANKAYVYYGSGNGLAITPDWSVSGVAKSEYGYTVGTAGDVNGDGYDDLIVGSPGLDSDKGKAYVYHGSSSGLNTSANWSASGEATGNQYGAGVSTAGDVNGDGFADIIVGAPVHNSQVGKVYVYYGSSTGIGGTPWTNMGESALNEYGHSVGTAGDVNGDGFSEIAVGAWNYDDGRGKVYVYDGSALGPAGTPWTMQGENNHSSAMGADVFGDAVGTAGDINSDGYDDFVVGATQYGVSRGKVYVFHGSTSGLAGVSWTALGEGDNDYFGAAVGSAGDMNGDGYDDLYIGAPENPQTPGRAYVYYGSEGGLAGISWSATGESNGSDFGDAIGTAGDVNGDGFSDIIVGSYEYSSSRGKAYLYYGSEGGWTAAGENATDALGSTVGTAGDVNGDGFSDVIIAAPGYDNETGKVYAYHGSAAGLPETATWSASGEDAGDLFGWSADAAGDINDDGYGDLVVGAYGRDNMTGEIVVFYGSKSGLSASPTWSASGENAGDRFGSSGGTVGDVNGDNYADLVVGAPSYSQGNGYGKVYVYYGSSEGLTAGMAAWTASGETAGDEFGSSVGTAADVNGDGYADLVVGAPGHASSKGKVYVYHGNLTGFAAGAANWTASGANIGDEFGVAVATAGDANGDGFSDLLVGAVGFDVSGAANVGKGYLYYGAVTGLGATPAWSKSGSGGNAHFGSSVGTIGDMNGDGYTDIIIGAYGKNNSTGEVYVYIGGSTGPTTGAANQSISGENPGDRLGWSAGAAGDINGDGFGDFIFGAPGYDAAGAANVGKGYLTLGTDKGISPVSIVTAAGGNTGDRYGANVALAGDVNGDGYADLIVSAGGYDAISGTDILTDAGKVTIYQ